MHFRRISDISNDIFCLRCRYPFIHFPHSPRADIHPSTLCIFEKGILTAMKKYTHKSRSQMSSERVSAPGTKNGSVTVEASFGIPLFLLAAVCLIWMIEVRSIRISVANASLNAAKSAAEDTAVIPVLNTIRLKSDIVELIGEDRIARSIIRGGSSGISCWKSYVSPFTGDMEVTVEYDIRLPVPMFGSPGAEQKETFTISAWTAAAAAAGKPGKTPGSSMSRTTGRSITKIRIVHTLSFPSVSFRRTDWTPCAMYGGSRYHACDKCVFGQAMTGVYVTEDGTKYHNSLSCSGLKRTVHAVEKSELAGLGGCSRCSG